MKIQIFFLYFLSLISGNIYAQSLDVGNIELRIGQDKKNALKSLSLFFVKKNEHLGISVDYEMYNIYNHSGADNSGDKLLGLIKVKQNKISEINKIYRWDGDSSNTTTAVDEWSLYSLARSDIHKRGGKNCKIKERVVENTELVYGFEKICGPYHLIYNISRYSELKDVILIYVASKE
jgi:hypothetical protein